MKLQFKHQPFQAEAAAAVCDVFNGQPYRTVTYRRDLGDTAGQQLSMEDSEVGFRNQPFIPEVTNRRILDNLRAVQRRNGLRPSDELTGPGVNLSIEMETGTGKTYTYVKTMYELNKRYGWSKYIIVVPSVAIREGVYEETQCLISSHFMDTFAMGNRCVVVGPRDASRHFEKNILTHAQVREIAASCAENLESSRGYLYLGLILLMTTGITISELCALTWGSFLSSNTYTEVAVIEIEAEAKRGGEVYHIEELNWPRRRTLPLPPAVAKFYHRIRDNAPNIQENAPFMRSFKNAARRMRPDEFDRWLKGFFKSFGFSKQPELKSLTKNPERTLRATFRST